MNDTSTRAILPAQKPGRTKNPHQSAAANDVLAERARQISEEGAKPEYDDTYKDHELARAAIAYARSGAGLVDIGNIPAQWPWMTHWWKPTTPRRDLVKAAALIIAEIERLDRAEEKS